MEKIVMFVAGILSAAGGTAYFLSQEDPVQHQSQSAAVNNDVPLELIDQTLLDRSPIRIGVRSNPQEKERMRNQIRHALRIVLADPAVATAYAKSETEQLIVPSLPQALRDLASRFPDAFEHLGIEAESAHGDAHTIAIETRDKENDRLLESKNFMMLRAELLQPENFPRLLATLDHECRHLPLRGMNLPRREEEVRVYIAGIQRMRSVAFALRQRGGEDAAMGERILNEVLPVHTKRLNTWQRNHEGK